MSRYLAPLSLSIAVLLLATTPNAGAVDVQRTDVQGAAGICRAATSAYAANVRNRPLSVTNVSSENVFLTCALQGDDAQFSGRGATSISLQATNEEGTTAHQLDCTLTNGQVSGGIAYANYASKATVVQPGAGVQFVWTPAEVPNSGGTIKLPALSCLLRPGMAVNSITRVYNENVGG